MSFYIYLLAWTMVSGVTASGWLGKAIPYKTMPLIGSVPVGPYIQVSVLMGILATAIFFAFVITDEERYVATLSDLVIYGPLRRGVSFALPYALRAIEGPPAQAEKVEQTVMNGRPID